MQGPRRISALRASGIVPVPCSSAKIRGPAMVSSAAAEDSSRYYVDNVAVVSRVATECPVPTIL